MITSAMVPKKNDLGTLTGIEHEIQREKAAALGRVGERRQASVAQMETVRNELIEIAGTRERCSGEVPSRLAECDVVWRELDATAKRLRYELIVQREACGPFGHEDVDRHYPIPTLPFSLAATDVEGEP